MEKEIVKPAATDDKSMWMEYADYLRKRIAELEAILYAEKKHDTEWSSES